MIREEIKKAYLAAGGLQENLANESQTIQGMLKAKNNLAVDSISNVTVAPMHAEAEVFGYTVSDLQSDVKVSKNGISGKLKKITEGSLVQTWGEGYFIALSFVNDGGHTDVVAGMVPSESSGLVPLDQDMAGVFKVTDKYRQNFVVKKTVNDVEHIQSFDFIGLILEA